jgi:dipeptidyl aminopeptidase/acylaminoacyl peptidase
MQSERLYEALRGLGGTTRLVMLPYESHGYRARESVLHVLWETERWLDTYVGHRAQAQETPTVGDAGR